MPHPAPRFRFSFSVTWFLALVGTGSLAWSQPTPVSISSRDTPIRDHQLFVGINLFLAHKNDVLPVANVEANHVILADGSRQSRLPIQRVRGFRWDAIPKICRQPARLDELVAERVYSTGGDPEKRAFEHMSTVMMAQGDQAANAADRATSMAITQQTRSGTPVHLLPPAALDSRERALSNAVRDQRAAAEAAEQLTDAKMQKNATEAFMDTGDFDAVDVSFWVSSPEPVADAYAVAIARISHRGEVDDMVLFKDIGAIDPTPRRVNIRKSGIQPGFELQDLKVHLFTTGGEMGTNLSEKSMNITAAEAREYQLLDHAITHEGETVPPSPIWGLAPSALRAIADPKGLDATVVVDINAKGELVKLRNARKVPEHIRSIVEEMSFLPALNAGEPVAGQCSFNLKDYFR